MKHYLLSYEFVPDFMARRAEYRPEHLRLAWAAHERGELVTAGALADPIDASLLLFQGESPAAAEAFARVDPYVTAGLVKSWRVREWLTAVGAMAAAPVLPDAI